MEHRHFLTPLFDPSSIVVIVEGDEALPPWASAIVEQPPKSLRRVTLLRLNDAAGLPEPGFDLAIVVGCHGAVSAALEAAAKLQVRAAVLVCDHADPADAREWARFAQRAGIRLLGPGTMGFVRPPLGLNAGRMGPMPKDGNLALVSQSGVLNGAILDWAAGTVLGFSLAVSLGAEADVDLAQVLDYLANDTRTRSVVVYLEAVRESRSFMSALRALASVKPVVVLKGHRDEASRRRALTHSGALCGSDAIYTAALRRAGAVQVRLFTQLFTAAQMLATSSSPLGRRLAVVSNGNGPAVLAADVAMWNGVRMPPPSAQTVATLAQRLPGVVAENPMNLGVDAAAPDFEAALAAVMNDPEFDAVLAMLAPYTGVDAAAITDTLVAASRASRKKVLACWMGGQGVRQYRRALDDAGIAVFRTPETAVDAYSTVTVFHQNQQLLQQTPRSLSGLESPDLDGARMLIESVLAERRQVLTEMESKALLGAFHIPVTRTMIARSPTEAIVIAEQMGFPVAMKIASHDVTHKSDVGGVVLNLRNAAEVRAQYAEILAAVRRAQPKARIEGITVQAMQRSRFARELYVGVYRDPLFGPVIAFGAGGTRIEVVRDTTIEFPPLNRFLARRMIERTRVAESLGEFRGAPAVDLEVLEAVLVRVSEMVCELPWIAEMDINPAIADENGVVAVDARIVVDPAGGNLPVRYAHMAIMPYPAHLTQVRSAPDGQFYTIRPIQPEDADRLQAFMRSLSAESRYFRFISTLSELTPKMLVRYTQIDYDRELALAAVLQDETLGVADVETGTDAGPGSGADAGPEGGPDRGPDSGPDGSPDSGGERIIGVVRYLLNPDRETCEFAIAIADDWQGKRLGSTLMRAIIEAARNKGLKRIEGYVLGSNARMLGLMTHLGFKVSTDRDDPSMRIVGMALN